MFINEETKCLKKLNTKYETAKLKNQYCSQTLTWATCIIARIAGWKNTNKQRPPKPIIQKNGLDKLMTYLKDGLWLNEVVF